MPLKYGCPSSTSSSRSVPLLQELLRRYCILYCTRQQVLSRSTLSSPRNSSAFKDTPNVTTFLHLCPGPRHPSMWSPCIRPVPQQLILKPADSMILWKDKIGCCYCIFLWRVHLWPFHLFPPSTVASQGHPRPVEMRWQFLYPRLQGFAQMPSSQWSLLRPH